MDEDRNLGTREDRLKLFVETELEFDAENYIDWRHCVKAIVDHCVSCITQDELALVGLDRTLRRDWPIPDIAIARRFVQSYDANAHTFNFRNREETLSLELIREALSLPEGIDTVPDFVRHKSFASWFPHYDAVGKKIFAHTCVKKKWIPIIQVINICLLARPRPQELHGKLAFTLISKVDREPALDFDWAKLILADVEREIKSLQGQIAKEGKRKPKWTYVGVFIAQLCHHLEQQDQRDANEAPLAITEGSDLSESASAFNWTRVEPDADIPPDSSPPPRRGKDPEEPGTSGRDFHGIGDHELSNVDDQPGTSGGDLHDDVVADEDIDNNRGTAEDSGRAGPSRTRPVTEEEMAALERKRDSLWWEVDLLETKKIRFEMEKEELEAAIARNDSELMTAVRKLEGVQGELDNKVRSKQELEEEIAQKEAFWERYMKTLQLQIDGKKRSLHVLTAEVESAKRESAKIPRYSIARHVELLLKTFREVPVQSNGETRPANRFDELLAAVQDAMDSTETPEHSLASLLAAIDKDDKPQDSPSHHGQEVPERSGAERIPQPPPVEKECVSEDHTIKVTTVDNTSVTANTSGGSPNRRPTFQECVSDHQTAEVTTVDEVPVTANTSRTSPHSSQVAQTRKQKRKADSRLEEEPQLTKRPITDLPGRSTPQVPLSPRTAQQVPPPPRNTPQVPPPIRKTKPQVPPPPKKTTPKVPPPPRITFANLPPQRPPSTTARRPSAAGLPPLPPTAATRGRGRGRGRVGSTPAKQRTPARPRTSRRAAPKQPAPLPVNPNDGQDNKDDEMAEVWRDFAVVQAQMKAKQDEQREKDEHKHFVKFAKLREQKQIEDWRARNASDRKKWDDIVATFQYGAQNKYCSRTGYDPPRYEPIPRTSPKPPGRPRLPEPPQETAQEEIERKKRAYEKGIEERRPGTAPTCTHDLVWLPSTARKFSRHFEDIVAAFRQHGLEMATSSRGDKGKAPMVEQEDIGTEEGELLDVHPPLPEPVGRSGSDRKRKKPAREEEGPLAVALLPQTAEEKRIENARKKAEKDENTRRIGHTTPY
ncbi:hypothetical protein R1sor_011411 [Riccia sorocarpa]|uniref:Uncharacterized protein n=1 Tax=Riccia sorocarpa TaxID=122646 RepID=A0ABD3I0R8_9MARC